VLWSTNASDARRHDRNDRPHDDEPGAARRRCGALVIRAVDAAGNATDGVNAVGPYWIDATAPAALVLVPNGGEVWAHQSVQTIRWRASDATSGVASIATDYSTDGGATYPHHIVNPPPQDSTYA
jgi:hypothetical protein